MSHQNWIRLRPLSLLLVFVISQPVYAWLNNDTRGVSSLTTDLDLMIPYVEIFVVPYLLWYLFIGGTLIYLCFRSREQYQRVILAYAISLIACYTIYYYFQTTVQRPELTGTAPLTKLMRFVYGNDQPFNCFPSLHCLTCFLMMIAVRNGKFSKLVYWVVQVSSVVIIASTLFVKQHVILDAVGALIVAELSYYLATNLLREEVRMWVRKPSLLWTMNTRLES